MKKIVSVRVLEDYRVWLRFDDGVEGIADLSELVGRGVFAAWRDYAFFRRAFVADYGSLTWPGELDLCPDALWLQITRKQPEDFALAGAIRDGRETELVERDDVLQVLQAQSEDDRGTSGSNWPPMR